MSRELVPAATPQQQRHGEDDPDQNGNADQRPQAQAGECVGDQKREGKYQQSETRAG
ncbi:MAG: hypothetical protein MO852_09875 [Candidatus Devosia euplotis]|nr:hypothetical protein [Candidatus Devosia euplotis]